MYWLKMLGGKDEPLVNDWRDRHDRLMTGVESKRRIKASMRAGDGIAYYACGWYTVFAWGEVTSSPYEQDDDTYPWRVDVDVRAWVPKLHNGVYIEDAAVNGRELTVALRSSSHIELHPSEFEAIRASL